MSSKKNKIIFVGGSSFIGGNLIKHLKEKFEIINFSKKNKIKGIKNIKIDLSKNFDIKKISQINPQYLFFLVSLDHSKSEKNFNNSININFLSLCKILEEKNILSNLKSIIYISTLQVYGDEKFINSEEINPNPKNVYGLTHLLCEKYLKYFSLKNSINCIIYRVSNSYGVPYIERENSWNNAINDFVKNAFYKSSITIKSHGLYKRDFIYIDDLSKNIIKTFKKIKGFKIINTGSFKTIPIVTIAKMVKKIGEKYLKKKINLKILGKKDKKNYNLEFNSKLNLKFKFRNHESGILEIFKYLKKK